MARYSSTVNFGLNLGKPMSGSPNAASTLLLILPISPGKIIHEARQGLTGFRADGVIKRSSNAADGSVASQTHHPRRQRISHKFFLQRFARQAESHVHL